MSKTTLTGIERELEELEEEIREVRKRLPAHSVKPPVMMELLDLEDKRDALLKQLEARAEIHRAERSAVSRE